MIYGLHSKEYTGLIENASEGERILCETIYDQGQGDLKLEFTVNGGVDWLDIINTSSGLDISGEEIIVPGGSLGNDFQFRLEIDIPSSVEDMDISGNNVFGYHPEGREGRQLNFFDFQTDDKVGWSATKNNGLWSVNLPPGAYYYQYDYQNDLTKKTLPDNQFIIVGSGEIANSFGDKIQDKFKKSDEAFLSSTFTSFEWSKYMVADLGTKSEGSLRDFSQYQNDVKVKEGRIFKGDAYFEFIGFIIGKN